MQVRLQGSELCGVFRRRETVRLVSSKRARERSEGCGTAGRLVLERKKGAAVEALWRKRSLVMEVDGSRWTSGRARVCKGRAVG